MSIDEIKEKLSVLKENPDIHKVILFGSYARGDVTRRSDMDLVVIMDTPFSEEARKLDRLYIPTRYPNGLPDITPDMAYSIDDSNTSINAAQKILKEAARIINGTP